MGLILIVDCAANRSSPFHKKGAMGCEERRRLGDVNYIITSTPYMERRTPYI